MELEITEKWLCGSHLHPLYPNSRLKRRYFCQLNPSSFSSSFSPAADSSRGGENGVRLRLLRHEPRRLQRRRHPFSPGSPTWILELPKKAPKYLPGGGRGVLSDDGAISFRKGRYGQGQRFKSSVGCSGLPVGGRRKREARRYSCQAFWRRCSLPGASLLCSLLL